MCIVPENIILHLFTGKMREIYDIESLWVLGSEFDGKNAEGDAFDEFLDGNADFLSDFEPLDPTNSRTPKN